MKRLNIKSRAEGIIHGNNFYERGYYSGNYGVPDGEPWYTDMYGMSHSGFDVAFIPDDEKHALAILAKARTKKLKDKRLSSLGKTR